MKRKSITHYQKDEVYFVFFTMYSISFKILKTEK